MKKFLSLLLILVLLITLFCGCKEKAVAKTFSEINPENVEELVDKNLVSTLSALEFKEAKNIIFMIGDGMGQNIITATEAAFSEQLYEGKLAINRLPVKGWSRTRSADNEVTDSAAGATALSTGHRTANEVVAMDVACEISYETLLERASKKGKSTGIVATKSVTDATPAAFSAHVSNRGLQEEIASQQLTSFKDGTLDLLLGGGYTYFATHANLAALESAKQAGLTLSNDFDEIKKSSLPMLGLFEAESLDTTEKPSLAEMTYLALERLSDNENGFFLMVEGSQIDTRAHENNIWAEVGEMRYFDNAIAVALNFVCNNPDTVLVITADHETGGLELPQNLTKDNVSECTYQDTGHTAANVPVFAIGYGTEKLGVEQNNTDIAKFLFELLNK